MDQNTPAQQRVEWTLLHIDPLVVWPDAEVIARTRRGETLRRVVWHQFSNRTAHTPEGVSESQCGTHNFTDAVMPRRLSKSLPPIICKDCAATGELNEAQMQEAAAAIIAQVPTGQFH